MEKTNEYTDGECFADADLKMSHVEFFTSDWLFSQTV